MSEYSTTGASTFAQLRQTQAALAASQQDLSRVERERDLACALAADLFNDVDAARQERDLAAAELASAVQERDYLRALLDDQQAELSADLTLATAEVTAARQSARASRQELDTYRDGRLWQVAQRPVAPCSSCSQPITRGQAFQPLVAAKGYYTHCFCPDKES